MFDDRSKVVKRCALSRYEAGSMDLPRPLSAGQPGKPRMCRTNHFRNGGGIFKSCQYETLLRHWRWTDMLQQAYVLCLGILLLSGCSEAAFVNFENCLSPSTIQSKSPQLLQFVPLFAWVTFNATSESHNLNFTVYGNVEGIATQQPYPRPNDPQWQNPNETVGKIPDLGGPTGDEKYTTFSTALKVLGYVPYDPPDTRLCNTSALTPCPFSPVFNFTGNE